MVNVYLVLFLNTSSKIRSLTQQTNISKEHTGLSCTGSQLKSFSCLHLLILHNTHFYYDSQNHALHLWLLRLWNSQIGCGEELVYWNCQPFRPAVNYSVFHLVSVDYFLVVNIHLNSLYLVDFFFFVV